MGKKNAGTPSEKGPEKALGQYAVIQAKGKQHLVRAGQKVRLDLLRVDIGQEVSLDEVLLVGNDSEAEAACLVGSPAVSGASVKATVLGHGRAQKLISFKKKRRQGYKRKVGHRQGFTELLINEISV